MRENGGRTYASAAEDVVLLDEDGNVDGEPVPKKNEESVEPGFKVGGADDGEDNVCVREVSGRSARMGREERTDCGRHDDEEEAERQQHVSIGCSEQGSSEPTEE